MKNQSFYGPILLATAAMGTGLSAPVLAQDGRNLQLLDEIVVTARRREERLQDVPISMTVLTQEQVANANIVNAGDLATYTPSLAANNRFGDDNTSFAIRGFSQELRTTTSVGVYFAEVIAPRGANITQSGDGAGPGDFFDLENIQVLKGPQGTLFGRNTTGGAVLLTPKKPTDEFEGYAEVSVGNYDMKRAQGVINIPVSDTFGLRLGIDHQERDGYLRNISGIGPRDFADINYTALRASAVWNITDALENYTIVKYADSSNNGTTSSLIDCNPMHSFGAFCQGDLDARQAAGNFGEYDIYNFLPWAKSEMEQLQIINTTTWEISDKLTIKNILSYAEFESRADMAYGGVLWDLPIFGFIDGIPQPVPVGSQPAIFQMMGARDWPTTDQKSLVEEFQLQGTALGERLTWQAGLYYEKSEPNGTYGSLNPSMISCDLSTIGSKNIEDWRCNDLLAGLAQLQDPSVLSVGSGASAPGGVTYENKAVYVQGTYDLSDQWSMTAGLRYTDDKTSGWTEETVYFFPANIFGGYYAPVHSITETRKPKTSSSEPTWLVGLEYQPSDDVMLYGKYARGYRQGSVNVAGVSGWDTHGPEEVDTYEIGAKTTFGGQFPGTFNVAAFYNDFQGQQIQFGYFSTSGAGTTSILNAGTSTIWGVEADGTILLTDNLLVSASYSYLDTEIDKLVVPTPDQYPVNVVPGTVGSTGAEGEPLPYTPKHQLVLSANYRLPVDASLGDMVATLSYIYTDKQQGFEKATSPYAVLPSYELVNASFNWQGVAGSPVDLSVFVTNLFDEEYTSNVQGHWALAGVEIGRKGMPRMYGARLRYNF